MAGRRQNVWIAVFLLGMLLLAGTEIFTHLVTRNLFVAEQQKVIGKIYEKSPRICEEIVPYMFGENAGREDAEKGKQAMVALGYTGEGAYYLYQNTGWEQIYLISFLIQAAVAASLFCLFLYLGKKNREEEQRLIQDIRRAKEQKGELETEKYRFCGNVLVTEISKVLETLHAKERYLVEKNKRTQAFIENIAHQIKTPLSCISLSMDLVLEKEDGEQREKIMQCFYYLDSIEALMKRLLDIGRLEAGKILMRKEAVCMESILEECRDALPDGEDRIMIGKEDKEYEEYYGDDEWLKEAFSNLLKNCLEHDKSGDKIMVSLSYTAEGIKIVIRDHGEGISEKDLPHIFDRFYIPETAKSSHTGIGMNLAKLIIEKHFGSIKVMNHEEGGAVFVVILPVYALKTKSNKEK